MPDTGPALRDFQVTVKATPKPDEFEMYNLDVDPMELENLYGKQGYEDKQAVLADLLQKQRGDKRLTPCSGTVPGQDCNPWDGCAAVCSE